MPRYTITCTYETRSGGCSWGTVDLDAADIYEATRLGREKIESDGRRQIRRVRDTKARLIDQPRQFEQARFVMHGENQQQLPKRKPDHDLHLF